MGLSITPSKERHYGRWIFLVITIVAAAIIGWFVYQWYTTGAKPPIPLPLATADPRIDESDVSSVMVDTYQVPEGNPRYITIPTLNIEKTRVYPVGVTEENLLDTPRNINDAAWYKKSAPPGQGYGAVLINAHNGGISKNGVFAKLSQLKEGDEITVERGDGEEYSYQVVENQTMSLEEVNKNGMKMMMQSAEAGKEGLNLITCAGTWIPRMQQFDKRVMLRAVAIK